MSLVNVTYLVQVSTYVSARSVSVSVLFQLLTPYLHVFLWHVGDCPPYQCTGSLFTLGI